MKFKQNQYVPILKWKLGEQVALRHCSEQTKDGMTPLIEVLPIPWNFDNDCPTKTIDEHIAKIPETILGSWGSERVFFLDTMYISGELCSDGQVPITRIAEGCRELELRMIPVVYLRTPVNELDAVATIINRDGHGVCLRVIEDDLEDESIFQTMVDQVLSSLNVNYDSIDLILDLGYKPQPVKISYARSLINNVLSPDLNWRTFTIACTSFPPDMTEIERDSIEALLRIEWDLWEKLLAQYSSGSIKRMPRYGDYCIANPELPEINPRTMNQSGHIRYTIDDEFLIVKGGAVRDVKRGGVVVTEGRKFRQMVNLCQILIIRPEFRGADFSWGDQYIQDCANGTVSPGNATTWRQVATNHHLTFVVHQLANHPALVVGR